MVLYGATSDEPGTARDSAQPAKSLGIFRLSSDMVSLKFSIVWRSNGQESFEYLKFYSFRSKD